MLQEKTLFGDCDKVTEAMDLLGALCKRETRLKGLKKISYKEALKESE